MPWWLLDSSPGLSSGFLQSTDSAGTRISIFSRGLASHQTRRAAGSEAAVVTARYLDEALIGLSSEPFVYANLAQRVEEFLRVPVERTGRRAYNLIGFDNGISPGFVSPVGWLFQRVLNFLWLAVLVVWKPLRQRFVVPRMTQALINILNSAACGIPTDELRRARLAVLPRLDLPEVFEEEYQDVTDLFLRPRERKFHRRPGRGRPGYGPVRLPSKGRGPRPKDARREQ